MDNEDARDVIDMLYQRAVTAKLIGGVSDVDVIDNDADTSGFWYDHYSMYYIPNAVTPEAFEEMVRAKPN